jgi:hypothetical protein
MRLATKTHTSRTLRIVSGIQLLCSGAPFVIVCAITGEANAKATHANWKACLSMSAS